MLGNNLWHNHLWQWLEESCRLKRILGYLEFDINPTRVSQQKPFWPMRCTIAEFSSRWCNTGGTWPEWHTKKRERAAGTWSGCAITNRVQSFSAAQDAATGWRRIRGLWTLGPAAVGYVVRFSRVEFARTKTVVTFQSSYKLFASNTAVCPLQFWLPGCADHQIWILSYIYCEATHVCYIENAREVTHVILMLLVEQGWSLLNKTCLPTWLFWFDMFAHIKI